MIVDPSAQTAAEESARPATAQAGETLGKYKLERVLGTGGMGVVWAAFDPDLERAVAIKLLHSSDVPTLRTRLLREARAMARLKHPNVLTVYEVGTDKNRDYIAMEIVDGTTLDAWLETRPARPELLDALLAAGRGLAAAHAAGLVHRDFKPHNVLRSKDGHVYVTDFGLARGQIEDGSEVEHASHAISGPRSPDLFVSPLTQTGVMIGTPAYMAPEQFAGKTPDARTDQFAFAVTAWEALTGARPFRGETLPELEAAVAAGPANLEADLPPRLRAVLVRGLDPDPAARWPDLRAMLDALAAAVAPAPEPRRRSRMPLLAGLALLALAGGGLVYYVSTRSPNLPVVTVPAECEPVETAFDVAWPAARRIEVLRENGPKASGHVYILDGIREQWTAAYAQTCRRARDARRRRTLDCLLHVRDEAQRISVRLASDDDQVRVEEVAMLHPMLNGCTGEPLTPKSFGVDIEPPEPPEPPRAPEAPRKIEWER